MGTTETETKAVVKSNSLSLIGVYSTASLAVLLWGASPDGTKLALAEVSPLGVMAIRTVAGGLAGLIFAICLGIRLPATGRDKIQVALAGCCGMVAFPTLFSFGMQATSALHGAMILACMPITTSAIAYAYRSKVPPVLWWIGCGLALAGEVVLIFQQRDVIGNDATVYGDIFVFCSTLFACAGYVIGANLQERGYPARGITFWGAAISASFLLPFTPWLIGPIDPKSWQISTWISLAYLAFGVTILGYVCWYWALGRGGVSRISLMQFLQPVSGLTLSIAMLGDRINPSMILAAFLVVSGTIASLRVPKA